MLRATVGRKPYFMHDAFHVTGISPAGTMRQHDLTALEVHFSRKTLNAAWLSLHWVLYAGPFGTSGLVRRPRHLITPLFPRRPPRPPHVYFGFFEPLSRPNVV